MPAFLTSRPSSNSTPASRFALMSSTTALTGSLLATIPPTLSITSSSPLAIFCSCTIVETRKYTSASTMRTIRAMVTTPAAGISALLGVVEDHVERAAVVADDRDGLTDLLLRGEEQRRGVEVLRALEGGVGDRADARDDAPGGLENAAEEQDHDDEDHE